MLYPILSPQKRSRLNMVTYKVKYSVNTLAHLGKFYMEDRVGFVESNVNGDDESSLMKDIRKSLSLSESIPENQIKVMGWSEY